MCVLACTVCVWGKDWWRCWAIWMTGHANFQVKSVNAYRIKKMSTACLVTTLCLHLINSNGGGSFFFSKSGLIGLPEQIENIEEKIK